MAFRFVYGNTPTLRDDILAIVPGAVVNVTPTYAGYPGQTLCEVIVTDADEPTLSSNNPAPPLLSGPVSDGSGSLVTRRIQSIQIDGVAAIIAQLQTARVAPAGDVATKNTALDAAEDLLTNLLADAEQRPVDIG